MIQFSRCFEYGDALTSLLMFLEEHFVLVLYPHFPISLPQVSTSDFPFLVMEKSRIGQDLGGQRGWWTLFCRCVITAGRVGHWSHVRAVIKTLFGCSILGIMLQDPLIYMEILLSYIYIYIYMWIPLIFGSSPAVFKVCRKPPLLPACKPLELRGNDCHKAHRRCVLGCSGNLLARLWWRWRWRYDRRDWNYDRYYDNCHSCHSYCYSYLNCDSYSGHLYNYNDYNN